MGVLQKLVVVGEDCVSHIASISRLESIMDIKSVLVVEYVGKKCIEILNQHGIKVTQNFSLTEQDLIDEIPRSRFPLLLHTMLTRKPQPPLKILVGRELSEYDALVVQSGTKVPIEVLFAGKKLKVVASGGAYSKNIDVLAAMNRNIHVINAPRSTFVSVCEYTCTVILALARHLVKANYSYCAGMVDRAMYTGSELQGKTLAFIGLGEIAKGVAVRMKAFGMKVIGFDESFSDEEYRQYGIIKTTYEEMWPQADYIVLYTTPFDRSVCAFLTSDILKSCKRGVKIIIMGHLNVFLPRDMHEGLKSGQVGGAAFDLYDEYVDMDFLKYPVFQHSSVICTTHLAMETQEAIERGGKEVAEQIVNMWKPHTYDTPINFLTKFN
ncbi:PREDICTED: D-3-phosphoglycerate dehydrogenase-like [Papilio xuthus]|uniref:D-3-phosphoglycerate dehydrogenase-like n=1 Tax=Papilio xuthus TaxID=66420 RepID=A0AAJ6ZTN4_PAPXU|nr:PREDICTED: D-3-phosphoglycerate dehydrogenase-like [Papilio xuthus]